MCVICYKAKGRKLPDETTMRAMWRSNPDGAGIMWRTEKGVDFMKGFMKFDDFLGFVERNHDLLEGTECAMHFRIGTHGGNTPGNTHPFVVKPDADPHGIMGTGEPFVLMHNGILPVVPRSKDISDTAELALRAGLYAAPDAFLRDVDELIGSGNKIVLFRKDGDALFFGGEWKEGADGLKYSNLNHEFSMFHGSGFGGWPAWDEDYDPWADQLGQRTWTPPSKKKGGKKSKAKRDEPMFGPDEIPLPGYLDVGIEEAEWIARDYIADVATSYAGTDFMTEQDWNAFFESYRMDLEEMFWNDEDVQELVENASSAGAIERRNKQ